MRGDLALLKRLAAVYFEHTPALLQTIRTAASSGDMAELQKAAHTLKGSLAQFAAAETVQNAEQLEGSARDGEVAAARSLAGNLVVEVEQFNGALRQFLNTIIS